LSETSAPATEPLVAGPTGPTVPEPPLVRLTVGEGEAAREIAVLPRPGSAPGLFWMGGFRSDMAGTKAAALDAAAAEAGRAFTRFDYSGHGRSSGTFEEGTISRWLEESAAVFERFTSGPQVVVGSSMGGWLALLLATKLHAQRAELPSRIAGLVLLAPAVDFTEALIWNIMPKKVQKAFEASGFFDRPSEYSDPYRIPFTLVADGRKHLFGGRMIETGCPVHIIHGMKDEDVPWQGSTTLTTRFSSDDVVLTLIRDGDHRLSRPEDIERLKAAIAGLEMNVGG
jgi:pimeloyl-ACP methyl ester carboxylesterase